MDSSKEKNQLDYQIPEISLDYLLEHGHGVDLPALEQAIHHRWRSIEGRAEEKFVRAIQGLTTFPTSEKYFDGPEIRLGKRSDLSSDQWAKVYQLALDLKPWRKGPYNLYGLEVDAEWQCSIKWSRLWPSVGGISNKVVLDIGCNNGYYMYRMLPHAPKMVLGIDPIFRPWSQFQFVNSIARDPRVHHELLGIEHVDCFESFFDLVFFMGVIYHHRSPLDQLLAIRKAMRKSGTIIFETIGIPGDDPVALFPDGRYACMRNIWFVPTVACAVNWLKKAKFSDIQIISVTPMSTDEQRVTAWSTAASFEDFLDPNDKSKTVEGHPAPVRIALKASKATH